MSVIQILLLLMLGALVVVLLVKLLPMQHQLDELRKQIHANSAMQLAGGIQAIQQEQSRMAFATIQSAQALQQEQVRVAETLGQVTQGVSALKRFQDEVRDQLVGMGQWAQAFSSLQGESREVLQRMQLLLAGTPHRGAAGESILREILSRLPAGLREENVRINNQVVEFAVKLPGDKFLPIDSKWPAVAEPCATREKRSSRSGSLPSRCRRLRSGRCWWNPLPDCDAGSA